MLGFVILVIIFIIWILYSLYFKEYRDVMAMYETLVKVLETRDLLLMRILPEVKDKKIREETSRLVQNRMQCKNAGCNLLVKSGLKRNKELKKT